MTAQSKSEIYIWELVDKFAINNAMIRMGEESISESAILRSIPSPATVWECV